MPSHFSPLLSSAATGQGKRSPYRSQRPSFSSRYRWIFSGLPASCQFRSSKACRCSSGVYPKSFKKRSYCPFRSDRAVLLLFEKILRGELRSNSSRTRTLRGGALDGSLQIEAESEEGEPPLTIPSPCISSRLGYPQRSPPRCSVALLKPLRLGVLL
ncbi:hypothetical protein IFO70_17270 [Phormidium tenue FACHB-886]|nr:hypothetical protein [Phormidium tenue FACHB-886]